MAVTAISDPLSSLSEDERTSIDKACSVLGDWHRPFLAQIRLNPSDDEARLIYADRLEELGDDKASWIRLEIELSSDDNLFRCHKSAVIDEGKCLVIRPVSSASCSPTSYSPAWESKPESKEIETPVFLGEVETPLKEVLVQHYLQVPGLREPVVAFAGRGFPGEPIALTLKNPAGWPPLLGDSEWHILMSR